MHTRRFLAVSALEAPVMSVDVSAARSAYAQHLLLRHTRQPGSARHIPRLPNTHALCAPPWRSAPASTHGQAREHLGSFLLEAENCHGLVQGGHLASVLEQTRRAEVTSACRREAPSRAHTGTSLRPYRLHVQAPRDGWGRKRGGLSDIAWSSVN